MKQSQTKAMFYFRLLSTGGIEITSCNYLLKMAASLHCQLLCYHKQEFNFRFHTSTPSLRDL